MYVIVTGAKNLVLGNIIIIVIIIIIIHQFHGDTSLETKLQDRIQDM